MKKCNNRSIEMTKKQWIEENNINIKYYYWQKNIRKSVAHEIKELATCDTVSCKDKVKEKVSFVKISLYNSDDNKTFKADAIIKTPSMTIAITNNISAYFLSKILEASSDAG